MKTLFARALPCWLPRPLAALGLLLATAGAAHAQTPTTFTYTGAPQTYVVPAGVTQLQVVATGARAGNIATRYGHGGVGAVVSATVTVVPNETLTILVGGTSSGATGGYNGGGNGAGRGVDGGGGATDLRRTGASTGDYLSTRNALVVAGGGGGGVSSVGDGGSGGTPTGGNGGDNGGIVTGGAGGGKGATQSNAGAGGLAFCVGTTSCGIAGGSGSNGTGGNGTISTGNGGAGGGAGYYGGGGGAGGDFVDGRKAAGGAGGGGSSWVTPTGSSAISYSLATTATNGTLTITPIATPTLTTVSPPSGSAGTLVTLTGTNLTGATAVRFNGTAATTFAVVDDKTVTATVPSGATSGPVTVTSPDGTSNGVTFTVTTAPTVSTQAPGNLTSTSATLGGNVTADGNAAVTDRGVVYSSSTSTPTIDGAGVTKDANGSGTGSYSKTITGLLPNTTYYVRAYATNNVGTTYGSALSFTTPCQAPVLTQVPATQTVPADAGQCTARVSFQAQASGLPAATLTYALGSVPISSPYDFPLGSSTVTVTATNCGGSVSSSFAVTVQDTQAPVAQTQNITVPLVNGQATITAAQVNNGSTDNCTSAAALRLRVSPSTFTCATAGINQVTLTVTDASGNESTQTATVTVTGSVPQPTISVSPAPTIYLGFGPQTATLTASGGEPGATYQWSPATTLSATTGPVSVFTPTTAGTYPYTVTVTNPSGCSAQASVLLTVVDARCGSGNSGKNDKVLVCHKGNTLCLSANGVQDHLNHGDQLGACSGKTQTADSQGLAVQAAAEGASEARTSLEAYPNPFTSSTTFRFQAAQAGSVQLQVYNALGQLMATLYNGPVQRGEVLERTLDGTGLSAGLYTCRFAMEGGQHLTQRVVLTK